MAPSTVRLVISVDTEEDNWVPTTTGISVANIDALPRFHAAMQALEMRPTYFTSYQVAMDPRARDTVRGLAADGGAEIGAHLHPWNTPPLDAPLTGANTVTKNLPPVLQRRKLELLTKRHREAFGAPVSFRAGRFGFGGDMVGPLLDLGYRVDSSVTPYLNWERHDGGPDFRRAPIEIYRLDRESRDVTVPVPNGALTEVPLSCGFSRHPFALWSWFHHVLGRPLPRRLHARGIVGRVGLFREIFLSPELHEVGDLLTLARLLLERNTSFLHLMLHSPTLTAGLTPFGSTPTAANRVFRRAEEFVVGLAKMTTPVAATVQDLIDVAVVGSGAHEA